MIRILMLAESKSANTLNWVENLRRHGEAVVEVWSLPNVSGWRRLMYLPFAILLVRRRISAFHPQILIAYRTTSYGFIGAMAGFRPLVLAAQGESDVWPPDHWSNTISTFMARRAIKNASLIHAWGRNMVPSLLRLGARESQVMVMPRGIDMATYWFSMPFSTPNELALIVSRSLFPEYNHRVIIKAFGTVVKLLRDVNCVLAIAGEGPLKRDLQKLADSLGVANNVKFLGHVSPERLTICLQKSDIYISLPNTEGVSSSLLEAMACGCFPIVSDLPANRQIISEGGNCRLVKIEAEAVVQSILEVWSKRELIRMSVTENRSFVESFADARVNTSKFVAVYSNLF